MYEELESIQDTSENEVTFWLMITGKYSVVCPSVVFTQDTTTGVFTEFNKSKKDCNSSSSKIRVYV